MGARTRALGRRAAAVVMLALGCVPGEGASDRAPAGSTGVHGTGARTSSSAQDDPSTESTGGSTGARASATDGTGSPPPEAELPGAYLRADPYPRLVLELDVVPDHGPYASTPQAIVATLTELLDKPAGIMTIVDDTLAPVGDDHAWTAAERFALADATFDLDVPADAIKIHVLFVDGHAAEDRGSDGVILGHAWANRHVMIYKSRLDAGCSDPLLGELTTGLCERSEFLLWQHELGHVLGLVDAGLPMQSDHRDPRNGPHDIDPGCVMYWRFDTLDLVDVVLDELLTGGAPVALDPECLLDIEAAKAQ